MRASRRPIPYLRVVGSHSPDEFDDSSLVEALRKRELWAIEATWNSHASDVFGLLVRATGSRADAESLTGDAFLKVLQKYRSLDERTDLASLFRGQAVRLLRRHLRWSRLRRLLRLPRRRLRRDDLQTQLRERAWTLTLRLYEALDELPAEERVIYALRSIERLGVSEIAALLGLRPAQVERLAARACRQLDLLARSDSLLELYASSDRPLQPDWPEGA